jgi:hypothetical protein
MAISGHELTSGRVHGVREEIANWRGRLRRIERERGRQWTERELGGPDVVAVTSQPRA